jgi:hypothetical protein
MLTCAESREAGAMLQMRLDGSTADRPVQARPVIVATPRPDASANGRGHHQKERVMSDNDDSDEQTVPRFVGKSSSHIGFTEYTDDMARMGSIEFMYYTHGRSDDIHHRFGCPGCDPKAKDDPRMAAWFRLEAKWQAKGDPPTCPIERQQWYNAKFRGRPWWNEERDSVAHYRPLPVVNGDAKV